MTDNETTVSLQKHEVITGILVDGRIERPFWAGEAFYFPEDDYFKLHLSIFPFPYYITRNKDSDRIYTVWAQKVKDVTPALFRRPVGKARVADTTKTYLEVEIPLINLRANPFLCLFPMK